MLKPVFPGRHQTYCNLRSTPRATSILPFSTFFLHASPGSDISSIKRSRTVDRASVRFRVAFHIPRVGCDEQLTIVSDQRRGDAPTTLNNSEWRVTRITHRRQRPKQWRG